MKKPLAQLSHHSGLSGHDRAFLHDPAKRNRPLRRPQHAPFTGFGTRRRFLTNTWTVLWRNSPELVNDSVPEKQVALVITAPGFGGSGSVNSGMVRLALKDPQNRKRSQKEIADDLSKLTKRYSEARTKRNAATHHFGEPTRRTAHPVHYPGAELPETEGKNPAVFRGSRQRPDLLAWST